MLLGPLLHSERSSWSVLKDREQFADELARMAYLYLTCADHAGEGA